MHCHGDEACSSPYSRDKMFKYGVETWVPTIKEVQGCKVCWQRDNHHVLRTTKVLLVDLMHQGAAFNADTYCITLEQLRAAMKRTFHR
jgi:hypothetical protein